MSAQNEYTEVNYEGAECHVPHAQMAKYEFPKPNYTLIFHNEDNMQIGKFDFNGEGLEFEGNATESAILFINWIAEEFKGRLEAEYQRGFEEGKKHETNT
jgi:hypothetical protein